MDLNKLIEEIAREIIAEMGDDSHLRLKNSSPPGAGGGQQREDPIPNLAAMIDHTLLRAEITYDDIEKLCTEAVQYGFATVCINPAFVKQAARILQGKSPKVCTVIGFPLGACTPVTKAVATRDALANGAREVDMVINVGALKSGDYDLVLKDIKMVVDAADGQATTKVILETCYLTEEEKIKACLLAKNAGADFVKTSTGFGKGGATAEDVALMRRTVGAGMGVKASGGIRDRATAEKMIRAGANRLGTSSGVHIVTGNSTPATTDY